MAVLSVAVVKESGGGWIGIKGLKMFKGERAARMEVVLRS